MYTLPRSNRSFEENIRGLIQFVVLAAGDSLPYEQASEVKKILQDDDPVAYRQKKSRKT